jgi:hypothetical protein
MTSVGGHLFKVYLLAWGVAALLMNLSSLLTFPHPKGGLALLMTKTANTLKTNKRSSLRGGTKFRRGNPSSFSFHTDKKEKKRWIATPLSGVRNDALHPEKLNNF